MPGPWRPSEAVALENVPYKFQSQTRCQAPGDSMCLMYRSIERIVSISDEMPGPWRPAKWQSLLAACTRFNLRRDARPLATRSRMSAFIVGGLFQSQTRCQAPGDANDPTLPRTSNARFNLRRDARPRATNA